MTTEEARTLKTGDYVLCGDIKYKVLNTKEHRGAHSGEIFLIVKCRRGNEVAWLFDEFLERYKE